MDLRTLIQAGPTKANELFARLFGTSGGAVKTRERLFTELKAELKLNTSLEEQHLFPVLRQNAETRDLVTDAIRDNEELRSKLAEFDALPKNDETFSERLKELQKAFRQHAHDEKREILPAVQLALTEEQVQGVADGIEAGVVTAEPVKDGEAEARPSKAPNASEANERQTARQAAAEQAEDETAGAIDLAVGQTATAAQTNAPQIAASTEACAKPVGAEICDAAVADSDSMQTMAPDLPAVAALPDAGLGAMTEIRSAWIGWIGQTTLAGTPMSQDLLRQLADQHRRFAVDAMQGWMVHNARIMHTTLLLAQAALRPFANRVSDGSSHRSAGP
jgi:Hemerythrin HHE cation binding domain